MQDNFTNTQPPSLSFKLILQVITRSEIFSKIKLKRYIPLKNDEKDAIHKSVE